MTSDGAGLRCLVISAFNASYVLVAGLSGAHKFRNSWYALPSQRVNSSARLIAASVIFLPRNTAPVFPRKLPSRQSPNLKIFSSRSTWCRRCLNFENFHLCCLMRYALCYLLSVYLSFRLSPLLRSRRHWNFPFLLIARAVYVVYPGWLFRRTAHPACVTLLLSLILAGVALRSASISVGATRESEEPRSWSVHYPRTGFTPNSCHVRLSNYVAFNDTFTRAAWMCMMP